MENSWLTGLQKIAKVLDETNDFSTATVQRKSALSRILENHRYCSRVKYSQGKLRLYTALKEQPKTNSKQPKTSTGNHKSCFDQKAQMERICPLCCEGIGNETHYIFECKNKEMIKVRNECMVPFYKNWKGLEKLSTENFYRAIVSAQNDDLLYEVGLLYLRIQETCELETFRIN